ncbi:MAG: hypothetical protein ACHQ4G_10635, partial [Opitutales bacterium]
MSNEYRSLMMRANRLLGAALVEQNLVKVEDLETANERLLEIANMGQPRQMTLLGLLAYELKVLREEDLLQHIVEQNGVGAVDLRSYDVPEDLKKDLDLGACWATWSVPFDREEDFNFVATAYYLSPAVRTFWEGQLKGPVLWFGTSLEVIADYLEKLEPAAMRLVGGSRAPLAAKTPGGTRAPFA